MEVKLCHIWGPDESIVRGHATVQISEGVYAVTMCFLDIVEECGELRVYINQPPKRSQHDEFVFSVSEELEQKIVDVVLDAYKLSVAR